MAKRKETETSGSDTAANAGRRAEKTQIRHRIASGRIAFDFSRDGGNRPLTLPPQKRRQHPPLPLKRRSRSR